MTKSSGFSSNNNNNNNNNKYNIFLERMRTSKKKQGARVKKLFPLIKILDQPMCLAISKPTF